MIACAYNFPAVLQAFGANKWPQLSKIFHTLIKKSSEVESLIQYKLLCLRVIFRFIKFPFYFTIKVKKPIACAMHEIAKIIGAEKAEKELFNVLEAFLKDQSA